MSITGDDLIRLYRKQPLPISCAAVALLFGLATYYRMDLLPAAEEELARVTKLGERQSTNIRNAAQLDEHYNALVAVNKAIAARVIRAGDLAQNSRYFYKIEAECGVRLLDLRPTSVAAKGKGLYIPVGYAVTVDGDYSNLIAFLTALETGTHFCRVMSVSIKNDSVPGGEPKPMSMTLTIDLLGTL